MKTILYTALFVAAMLIPLLAQARHIKVYTFNGPSRKAPAAIPTPASDPEGSMTLGNLVWASVNVDNFRTFATKPDMFTKFYQFNRKTAYSATNPCTPSWQIYSISEDTDWVAENAPCPTGWRLPTHVEFQTLRDSSATHGTWANANSARGNAVAGRFFGVSHATCSLPDNMAGCIFLSACGWRASGTLREQNTSGRYWSKNQANEYQYNDAYLYTATCLDFHFGWTESGTGASKVYGHPIRCVRDL